MKKSNKVFTQSLKKTSKSVTDKKEKPPPIAVTEGGNERGGGSAGRDPETVGGLVRSPFVGEGFILVGNGGKRKAELADGLVPGLDRLLSEIENGHPPENVHELRNGGPQQALLVVSGQSGNLGTLAQVQNPAKADTDETELLVEELQATLLCLLEGLLEVQCRLVALNVQNVEEAFGRFRGSVGSLHDGRSGGRDRLKVNDPKYPLLQPDGFLPIHSGRKHTDRRDKLVLVRVGAVFRLSPSSHLAHDDLPFCAQRFS